MAPQLSGDEEATRLGVGVPPREAERLRGVLQDLADTEVAALRTEDRIWFAVRPGTDRRSVTRALDGAGLDDVRLDDRRFPVRVRRPSHYRSLLRTLPPELQGLLPTGYDVVGRVAVVKLVEPLLPHAAEIAAALLAVHPNLRTVARDRGVGGPLRIRDLEVIGGDARLDTVHREHGLEVEVALDQVYFSPRLATERGRLAARVRPGQRVLDLFAGVGAFVCLVARDRAPGAVTAIDLNPLAVMYLGRNLRRNQVEAPVEVLHGDARQVAPRTKDWDHVVMNLPHDAAAFLDVAADCVAPDGEVHLYAMVEREDHGDVVRDIEGRLSALTGASWRVVEERHVRDYAPTMDGLGFTLRSAEAAPGPPE